MSRLFAVIRSSCSILGKKPDRHEIFLFSDLKSAEIFKKIYTELTLDKVEIQKLENNLVKID